MKHRSSIVPPVTSNLGTSPREEQGSSVSPISRVDETRPSGSERARSWRAHAARVLRSSVFLGLVLSFIGWPSSRKSLFVTGGLDQSWRAALTMAVHDRLHFGSQAVFTYGPLAFLVSPQAFYQSTAILGLVFSIGFSALTFGTLIWGLRRRAPLALAIVAAFVVGGLTRTSASYFGTRVATEDVLALALVFGVTVLSTPERRPPLWVWPTVGAGLGLFTLIKVSLGAGIAVILLITIVCLPLGRLRAAGAVLVGGGVSFAIIWFWTGNGVGNLYAYIRSCLEIIRGYGGAMSIEPPAEWYSYWLALAVAATAVAYALGHVLQFDRPSQVGIVLITLATLWFLFKESFVRHDGHALAFFVAAPIILAAFLPRWKSPTWVLGAVLCSVAVTGSVAGSVPVLTVQPVQAFQNFWRETTTVVSSAHIEHVMARSRAYLRGKFALTDAMVNDMRGRTVDVSPWEQDVVWAYPTFKFDSLPVIQDYSAYTPYLDALDVRALRSRRAPTYILRGLSSAIDGRNPVWDAPGAQLSIACRYDVVASTAQWQLLRKGPNRCGQSHLVERVTVALGRGVSVPSVPAQDVVTATFDFSNSLLSSAAAGFFKPPAVYMDVNHGGRVWRFVTGTGPDQHLLTGSFFHARQLESARNPITSFHFRARGFGGRPSTVTISFFELEIR